MVSGPKMKCPKCAAKLLLVKNDYFCLQCGELIYGASVKGEVVELLQLETTSEPVLQRAILDVSDEPREFQVSAPASEAVTPEIGLGAPAETIIQTTSALGLHEVLSLTKRADTHRPLNAKAQVSPSVSAIPAPVVAAIPVAIPQSNDVAPLVVSDSTQIMPPHKDDLHQSLAIPVVATTTPRTLPTNVNSPTQPVPVAPALSSALPSVATPPKLKDSIDKFGKSSTEHHWTHNLVYGSVLLGVLALANVAVGWYFQDKFYPGVSVAGKAVGGTPLANATASLSTIKTLDYVDFVVGSTTYHVKAEELGVKVDTASLISQAKRIGHDSAFPIMGIFQSLKGQTVAADYTVDEKIFETKVAQIAADQSHAATSAKVLVVGSNIISLSDKPGQELLPVDLTVALKSAIRSQTKVVISTTKIDPTVKIEAYKTDIDVVQARLNLTISIKLKTKTVTVPASEIARWVGFGEPGTGAKVLQAKISDYVATLGTGFDRAATVLALVSTVTAGKNLNYVANVKNTTAVSKIATTYQSLITYNYCISSMGASEDELRGFATKLESTYGDARGWTMGGAVKFDQVAAGCNYSVWLATPAFMDNFSPACHDQSTCRVANNLIINSDRWKAKPNDWTGSLEDYRVELINHETGHWLGFDHLACGKGVTAPIQSTLVLVWGCSANWWSVAPELQDVKVLPGF